VNGKPWPNRSVSVTKLCTENSRNAAIDNGYRIYAACGGVYITTARRSTAEKPERR
jgi:hypothetical protein